MSGLLENFLWDATPSTELLDIEFLLKQQPFWETSARHVETTFSMFAIRLCDYWSKECQVNIDTVEFPKSVDFGRLIMERR